MKKKSVEGFHPWPYHAALMNCFMWVFYAMPFVHPHSILVMTINTLGIALELSYLAVFFCFSNAKTRGKMVFLLLIQLLALAGIVAATLMGAHTTQKRSTIVGSLSVVFGIILYASPLSIMRTVIKSKSAEFLPGWLIASGFTNGIIWAAYACIRFDIFVFVSNGVGALLSFIQIILKIIYRNGPKPDQPKPSEAQTVYRIMKKIHQWEGFPSMAIPCGTDELLHVVFYLPLPFVHPHSILVMTIQTTSRHVRLGSSLFSPSFFCFSNAKTSVAATFSWGAAPPPKSRSNNCGDPLSVVLRGITFCLRGPRLSPSW
nr:Bidirectional sugar transporter SWEET6a [Ipomoea batatas]